MKVVLLKPNSKPQVVEIAKDHDYRDIKKLLEIDSPLTCVRRKVGNTYFDFWCDDEGLLTRKKFVCAYMDEPTEIICGNILIAQNDNMGNLIGLEDKDIELLTNVENYKVFIKNKEYLEWSGSPDYPTDNNGNRLIILNYNGFGEIFMNEDGCMLRYSI